MMDQRYEFHLFATNNSLNYICSLIIIVILEVVQVLICSDECLITQLLFKIDPQCFDSIAHGVSGLNSRQIFEKFWIHSHIWWFFMQVVLIRWLFILIIYYSLNCLCTLYISEAGMCPLTCFHHRVLLLLLLSIIHAPECKYLALVVVFRASFWLNDTSLILWIRNWNLLTSIGIILEVIWETGSATLSWRRLVLLL